MARTASATPAGQLTVAPRKKTPIRTATARDKSSSSTTASSKTILSKEQLQREGHKFVTETDTEVVAHLVEKNLQSSAGTTPLEEAVRKSLQQLRGISPLVFLPTSDPKKPAPARLAPPAVIGLGDGEY